MPDSGLIQLHRLVLEALPLAICVVNREGKVLLWSAGAEQMTGYFRQDVLGIVLWLMNSSKQIQEAVGGYFKGPTGSSKMGGSDMRGAGENFVVTKDNMKELKEQLQKTIRQVPRFDDLRSHIDMTVTNEGLRIELTESAASTFFR